MIPILSPERSLPACAFDQAELVTELCVILAFAGMDSQRVATLCREPQIGSQAIEDFDFGQLRHQRDR